MPGSVVPVEDCRSARNIYACVNRHLGIKLQGIANVMRHRDQTITSGYFVLGRSKHGHLKPFLNHSSLKGYSRQGQVHSVNLQVYTVLVVPSNCAQRSLMNN